jgi:flagellar biosynthesis component FlhA
MNQENTNILTQAVSVVRFLKQQLITGRFGYELNGVVCSTPQKTTVNTETGETSLSESYEYGIKKGFSIKDVDLSALETVLETIRDYIDKGNNIDQFINNIQKEMDDKIIKDNIIQEELKEFFELDDQEQA